MLLLVETASGFGLFRLKKNSLSEAEPEDICSYFETPEKAQKAIQLVAFSKFEDAQEALAATTSLIESELGKGLKKFLKKNIINEEISEELAVADKALGNVIRTKLGINTILTPQAQELMRGIRTQLHELVTGLSEGDVRMMSLALSHNLNRFKLKFSPEKVDTMIVQAIALLDDLDRELNNFAMRLKEWYGWHFPELVKIVSDNMAFAKTVQVIGFRSNTKHANLDEVIPDEDMRSEIKEAAEISMGTEITEKDLENIVTLAKRVESLSVYRSTLSDYLRTRMAAIAPNLTFMIGELVGARLIAHAGSLMNLAKNPASTVQILGAEKALFRALKAKKSTPKYGLIYHASLVGSAAPKMKGKVSRMLAAKLALCTRVDALGDQTEPTIAMDSRSYIERRLDELSSAGDNKSFHRPATQKFVPKREASGGYNAGADEARKRPRNDDAPAHKTKREKKDE